MTPAAPASPPTLDEAVDRLTREWLQVKGPMTLAYNRNLVKQGLRDAVEALKDAPPKVFHVHHYGPGMHPTPAEVVSAPTGVQA